jgi:hypothetical protein
MAMPNWLTIDARLADEGGAQVETRKAADEGDELRHDRLVRADLAARRVDLRLGRADAQQRIGRIARQQPQQHEQHHRRDQQRQQQNGTAAEQVSENGAVLSRAMLNTSSP